MGSCIRSSSCAALGKAFELAPETPGDRSTFCFVRADSECADEVSPGRRRGASRGRPGGTSAMTPQTWVCLELSAFPFANSESGFGYGCSERLLFFWGRTNTSWVSNNC
eukprot:5965888-Alexandrium_andersonii.AAC.1